MLPDKMEHCIVFMNSWDVSGVFWSFSKCNITIPHFSTGDSTSTRSQSPTSQRLHRSAPKDLLWVVRVRPHGRRGCPDTCAFC